MQRHMCATRSTENRATLATRLKTAKKNLFGIGPQDSGGVVSRMCLQQRITDNNATSAMPIFTKPTELL